MPQPKSPSIKSIATSGWGLAAVSSLALLVALFAIWPYQHGHLEERQSLLTGLIYVATQIQGGEWVFCLFVPFISAFLVYLQRHRFRGISVAGHNSALIFFVIAAGLYWLGYKADTRYPGFIAIQALLAAITVWFAGWRFMLAIFLPWLFFSFTWPMLPLESILAFPLRVITARASTGFLEMIGIDAVRQGTGIVSAADPVLQIPEGAKFSLDVATPCSGIRSLFSLMMIAAFYSFIALEGTWKRLLLFASSIPLAMLGNFVRTVILTTGSLLFGSSFAIGEGDRTSTFHMVSGFAVFGVALAGMFAITRILDTIRSRPNKDRSNTGSPSAQRIVAPPWWRSLFPALFGAATLMTCYLTPVSTSLSEPGMSLDFPVVLGAYGGEERPMSKIEKRELPSDIELKRYYYHGSGTHDILATVVVSGATERSLHEPEVCLPGQGWTIDDRFTVEVRLDDGQVRNAMLLKLHRDRNPDSNRPVRTSAYNIYWYEGFNISTPNYQEHVVLTHIDNIFKNVSHRWSMASFFLQLPPEPIGALGQSDHANEIESLKSFIGTFTPKILRTNDPTSD